MAEGEGNVRNFLNIFTRRLKDISLPNWHSQINDSPKHCIINNLSHTLYMQNNFLQRNVYVVEDEFYFFILCPMYDTLRNMYFRSQWKTNISVQNSTSLCSCLMLIGYYYYFFFFAIEFRKSI